MFSSQFDENPFAEDARGEILSSAHQDISNSPIKVEKRERDEKNMLENEPKQKIARHNEVADEPKDMEAEDVAPYIGYSVEDTQEGGEEGDGTDDAYYVLLARVAEMEATRKLSARTHRFRVTLAKQEKEVLNTNLTRLRKSLVEIQQKRQKISQTAAGTSEDESGSQANVEFLDLVTLLNACDGAERLKRLATHVHLLKCMEKGKDSVDEGNCNTSVLSESWMPMTLVSEPDIVPYQPSYDAVGWFKDVQHALEKLQTELDPHITRVVSSLQNEIQRLCEKSDALSAVKASLELQDRWLSAKWSEHVLWGTERSIFVSEEQMNSNISALHFLSTEQHLFRQQQQLQRRLHRAEVAIGTLVAAASGISLQSVSPTALQAALRRHQELGQLQGRLIREILYLRKLLRDRLVLSPLLEWNTDFISAAKMTADEGRSALLQHCCAALAKKVGESTQQIVSEAIRGSSACSSSAEQDEQLLLLEEKAGTLYASIVTFLTENSRLRQEIKDVSQIKHIAVPGSASIMLLAERLQTPLQCQTIAGQEEGEGEGEGEEDDDAEDDDNERNRNDGGDEEDLDMQKQLVRIFTESTEALANMLITHLHNVTTLFKEQKELFRDIAFLMRMVIAADRLLLGKVGVPFSSNSVDDVAKKLDEAHVCFTPSQNILRKLPSLDAINSLFESQSSRHEADLLAQCGTAAKTWRELQDDVEWCRQQCPKTAAAKLLEAQKELRNLETLLSAARARERVTAPLEAELTRSKEQLAQLQHSMRVLEEELSIAEEQCRILQERVEAREPEVELTGAPELQPDGAQQDKSSDAADSVKNKNSNDEGVVLCGMEIPVIRDSEEVGPEA